MNRCSAFHQTKLYPKESVIHPSGKGKSTCLACFPGRERYTTHTHTIKCNEESHKNTQVTQGI